MKRVPGTDLIVQNIFCMGRNYAEHVKELGNTLPSEPVVFLKPTSAICTDGAEIPLPRISQRIEHEVEIILAIGQGGRDIPVTSAPAHLAAIGVGIDLTARDLQNQAKEKGLPWTLAKGLDGFAPISTFVPCPRDPEKLNSLAFNLRVNGELRQKGTSAEMLTPIAELISYLSRHFTLSPGDLIFTGTPRGVAPVVSGDLLEAELEGLISLRISIC